MLLRVDIVDADDDDDVDDEDGKGMDDDEDGVILRVTGGAPLEIDDEVLKSYVCVLAFLLLVLATTST